MGPFVPHAPAALNDGTYHILGLDSAQHTEGVWLLEQPKIERS